MAASKESKNLDSSPPDQDNSASNAVSSYLTDMVNARDLQEIMESQNAILQRFEKTNETLTRVNALSQVRFDAVSSEFTNHISMLTEMKRNLDTVFKRIRAMKQVVQTRYPEAYEACKVSYEPPDDEDDEDDETKPDVKDDTPDRS